MAFDGLQFEIGADARQLYKEFEKIGARARSAAGLISGYFAAIGGGLLAGAGTLGLALQQVVSTGSEMESLQSRLTTIMGSSEAAQARMGELFQFAVSTPFNLDGVVNAEVTLRGFGAAAEELLPGLIDFAAGSKTELSQAAIDIGKAWNQGATGMESDGARVLRSQMELRTGLDLTKVSITKFREELLTELNTGMFHGAAAALSMTMEGTIANLEDQWTQFKLAVADAGVFDNVKVLLQEVLLIIDQNRDALGEMARVASTVLWDAVKGIVLAIGYGLDQTEGWAYAFAKVGEFAALAGQAQVDALQATASAAERVTGALGMDGVSGKLHGAASYLDHLSDTTGGLAADAHAWAGGIDVSNDKLAKAMQLLDDTEAIAAKLGTGASGELRPPGGAPKAAGDDKAAKRRQQELEQEIDAALNFADEMAHIGDTETEQAKAELDQRLDDLEAFHAEGLIQGQLYTDTLTAIYQNYNDTLGEIQADALKKQAEADEKAAKQRRDMLFDELGLVADIAGGMSDLWVTESGKQTAASRAAAHTSVGISEAIAVMAGFEKGPVYGALNLVAVGLQAIKAHSDINKAHQGRVFAPDVAPDEITMLRSELGGILNSQAVRRYGADTVQAMNAGTYGGGVQVLELRVNDTVQRAVIHQQLNGNTELNRALGSAARNRAPGLSGRLAAA